MIWKVDPASNPASLGMLDSHGDDRLDKWTKLAAALLDAPISLLSVIEPDRQFFRSQSGLREPHSSSRQTPLSHSFCKHVVDDNEPLVVHNASQDSRVAGNGAIVDMGVRSYLGCPVRLPDGTPFASLCVIDTRPRSWNERDISIVDAIADSITLEVANRAERQARVALQAHIENVVGNLDMLVILLDDTGRIAWHNDTGAETVGVNLSPTALGARAVEVLGWAGTEHADRLEAAMEAARQGETQRFQIEIDRDENTRMAELSLAPKLSSNGELQSIVLTIRDVSENAFAEKRRQLVLNEMAHRIRNSMTVVASLAAQTLRGATSVEVAAVDLQQRIMAMARCHTALAAEDWQSAEFGRLVREELVQYQEQVNVDGPSVKFDAQTVQTLAMIIHELSTNAAKYGALSTGEGVVSVSWSRTTDGYQFEWRETGGPPVQPPSGSGFGDNIIRKSAMAMFSNEPQLAYEPDGFVYRLLVPASHATA